MKVNAWYLARGQSKYASIVKSTSQQWRCFQTHSIRSYPLISRTVERRRDTIDDVQRLTTAISERPRSTGSFSISKVSSGPIDLRGNGAAPPRNLKQVHRRPIPSSIDPSNVTQRRTIPHNASHKLSETTKRKVAPPRRPKNSRTGLGRSTGGASAFGEQWKEIHELTPGEAEYAQQKAERQNSQRNWEPYTSVSEDLASLSPSWPVGELGVLETIRRRLRAMGVPSQTDGDVRDHELAMTLLRGDFVHFIDEEEKKNALRVAEVITKSASTKRAEDTGDAHDFNLPDFESVAEEPRRVMEVSLIGGQYRGPVDTKAPESVANIIHLLRKNESYTERSESKLLKKLSSLAPVARTSRRHSTARVQKVATASVQ